MKSLSFLPLLFLAACAANPATGGRTFSLVSQKEERLIGETAAESVLKTYGLYKPESRINRYVTDLCARTFAVTEAAAEPIQCNLIDDGSFNASATPGYMLINRGLLPFLSSEAELAAVLGHESGHLTARHINQAATHAKVAGLAVAALGIAVAAKTDNAATTNAALAAGGIGAAVGLSAYSRAHEVEADALGRRYMEKLGFDPRDSVTMVRAMQMYDDYQKKQSAAFNNGKIAPTSLLDRLKSSHPATPERVAAALAAAGEPAPASIISDTTGRARYMDAITGLAWGPSVRHGIARYGELVLPRQRAVVPLPDGVTTAHTGGNKEGELGTWLIGHPQSGAYVTVTAIKITEGRSPAALVESMLPLIRSDVARMPVGGGEGATTGYTATYQYVGSAKRYRLLAVPARDDQMLLLTAVYPDEATLQKEDTDLFAILANIRFVSEERAKAYQPLVLFPFRAAQGETVASRAAKLPVTALQEDLFRALNNLPEGTEMLPGQLYKTIVDPNN